MPRQRLTSRADCACDNDCNLKKAHERCFFRIANKQTANFCNCGNSEASQLRLDVKVSGVKVCPLLRDLQLGRACCQTVATAAGHSKGELIKAEFHVHANQNNQCWVVYGPT